MVSKLGITSIFVTHDQDEAVEVADEILLQIMERLSRWERRLKFINDQRHRL